MTAHNSERAQTMQMWLTPALLGASLVLLGWLIADVRDLRSTFDVRIRANTEQTVYLRATLESRGLMVPSGANQKLVGPP